MRPFLAFHMSSPAGEEFDAAIVEVDGTGSVLYTNRRGPWAVERDLLLADVVMPQHELAEWEVEEIDAGAIEIAA